MTTQSLPSLSNLFAQTAQIIKNNLKQFIAFYLIQVGIGVATGLFFLIGGGVAIFGFTTGKSLLILGGIANLWPQIALVSFIANRDKKLGIVDSFKQTKGKLLPYMWLVFLEFLIIFGGLMFFVIPGILLMISFFFSIYILVLEKDRGLTALLRSHQYIKGYRLAIVGRLLVLIIIAIVISIVWQQIGDQIAPKSATFGAKILVQIVDSFISNGIGLVIFVFGFLLYENIKRIKGDFAYTPSQSAKLKLVAIGLWWISIVMLTFISGAVLGKFPGRQFVQARDTQRRADLYAITNALNMYAQDHVGLPENFPLERICIGTGTGCYDLTNSLVSAYISRVPKDPSTGTDINTGYFIYVNESRTLVATAKSEVDLSTDITVERVMTPTPTY